MIRLLIPERFEGVPGSGQWKDLQGIRQVLDRLDVEWGEFSFDGQNIRELIARIGEAEDTVIWYYTFWPEAMEELKASCPRVRLILRTVNAEPLQQWLRAEKDWRRLRGLPRDLYGCARLLLRDRRCARAADALAGISLWDNSYYWSRLGGKKKVQVVPYVCPWPGLQPEVKILSWDAREDTILCLAGTRDAIGRGHIAGFAALAAHPELSRWHFASSDGFMDASGDKLPDDVERMGRVSEPWHLLCQVKAVAVLSPLGYGYKTTISDALVAGCHVLIHPRQHARLSRENQAVTIPLDPLDPAGLETLNDMLFRPPKRETSSATQLDCSLTAWKGVLER